MLRGIGCALFAAVTLFAHAAVAEGSSSQFESAESPTFETGDRSVTVFGGLASTSNFSKLVLMPWESSVEWDIPWLGAALSQRVWSFTDALTVEVEAGAGYRFGSEKTGEAWSAIYLRYDDFPWNHRVYTSVAASTGLNLASRVSPLEKIKSENGGSRLLHYFSPEITFALPSQPNVELMFRLHHRSGIFGTINGARGGNQYGTVGLRWRF